MAESRTITVTTDSNGYFEAEIALSGGPGITSVDVKATPEGGASLSSNEDVKATPEGGESSSSREEPVISVDGTWNYSDSDGSTGRVSLTNGTWEFGTYTVSGNNFTIYYDDSDGSCTNTGMLSSDGNTIEGTFTCKRKATGETHSGTFTMVR